MKKSKKNEGALAKIEAHNEVKTTENTSAPAVAETNSEPAQLGRPVNPGSARQQKLAAMQAKREAGLLKRGRPVNGTSARQKRLAEMAAKKAANGGILKRGRPVSGESARQQKLAAIEAKKAAGIEIKRGRPAMPKTEEPVAVENSSTESAK